mgnify:CR=1 FL=1
MATWAKGVGNIVRTAFGPLTSITDVFQTLKNIVGGANEALQVEARLTNIVEQTGQAAGFTTKQLMEMAEARALLVQYDDDAIKSSQALLAAFKNIKGDTFSNATNAAQDLATALDMAWLSFTREPLFAGWKSLRFQQIVCA